MIKLAEDSYVVLTMWDEYDEDEVTEISLWSEYRDGSGDLFLRIGGDDGIQYSVLAWKNLVDKINDIVNDVDSFKKSHSLP